MQANFPFFDLTPEVDNFTITSGLLSTLPGGLRGLAGNDTITGSSDGDLVLGGAGNDSLLGAAGNDSLFGGEGNDNIFGQANNDILNGMQADDFINGGDGDDLLRGGKGDDYLIGGNGNDTLIGDRGVNINFGGAGSDVFVFRQDLLLGNTSDSINLTVPQLILDFDPSSDFIGLSGGLSANQLTFSTQTVPSTQVYNLFVGSGRGTRFINEGLITPTSFDRDGNGSTDVTLISVGANGPYVASIIDATQEQIASRFITVNI
ncbi:calcium-binding protein [Microseira sp. BLCC-F43]|jgi:Ca2+-binding RTX toxin-like protein|uniref:calcium-binding protein n=1 Tax=Microseira sp. BLCC-F43 TaxID=3153602 RepID=UPI0035BB4A76